MSAFTVVEGEGSFDMSFERAHVRFDCAGLHKVHFATVCDILRPHKSGTVGFVHRFIGCSGVCWT